MLFFKNWKNRLDVFLQDVAADLIFYRLVRDQGADCWIGPGVVVGRYAGIFSNTVGKTPKCGEGIVPCTKTIPKCVVCEVSRNTWRVRDDV